VGIIEGCAANETLQGRVATRKPGPGRKEEAALSFGGLWQIPRGKWHRPPPLTFGGLWRRLAPPEFTPQHNPSYVNWIVWPATGLIGRAAANKKPKL
jgi:hypothetical protein